MNALHWYDKSYDLWRALATSPRAPGSWLTPNTTSTETVEPLLPC